jgi:hypothetical protein
LPRGFPRSCSGAPTQLDLCGVVPPPAVPRHVPWSAGNRRLSDLPGHRPSDPTDAARSQPAAPARTPISHHMARTQQQHQYSVDCATGRSTLSIFLTPPRGRRTVSGYESARAHAPWPRARPPLPRSSRGPAPARTASPPPRRRLTGGAASSPSGTEAIPQLSQLSLCTAPAVA